MLTVAPRHWTDEEQALFTVVRWWRRLRFDWSQFLLAWCAAFHLITAITLALAPYDQILSQGTRPVLDIASRYVWAVAFAAVGLSITYLWRPRGRTVSKLIWVAALFLGGMWLTAFALAVFNGEGNAIGVVVWPFLYGPWAVVAVRRSLGKR